MNIVLLGTKNAIFLEIYIASILWFSPRIQALVENHIFSECDAQHTIGSVLSY